MIKNIKNQLLALGFFLSLASMNFDAMEQQSGDVEFIQPLFFDSLLSQDGDDARPSAAAPKLAQSVPEKYKVTGGNLALVKELYKKAFREDVSLLGEGALNNKIFDKTSYFNGELSARFDQIERIASKASLTKVFSDNLMEFVFFYAPLLVAHALVEAGCESLCRFRKTDGNEPGVKGFGKDWLKRVAGCGKDGFISRWSFLKVPLKCLISSLIACLCRGSWMDFRPIALIAGATLTLFVVAHLGVELACEVKDRIARRANNTLGAKGFFKDYWKRIVDGKKGEKSDWWTIGKFPIKAVGTLLVVFAVAFGYANYEVRYHKALLVALKNH